MTRIELTVDGGSVSDDVEPRMLLVQYLREKLGKTGTVVGCDTSNCGACTVHLDGRSVKSCNVLAVQADGHEVTTIEGLAQGGSCTRCSRRSTSATRSSAATARPGMIMQAIDLLKDNPNPTEEEIRPGSRATSAAAPATTTSSRPCSSGRSRAAPSVRAESTQRSPRRTPRPPRSASAAGARRTSG